MKCCGIYGYTDAGKTTFVEKLVDRPLRKYKQQIVRGITLKVGYMSYYTPTQQQVYILDHPGHLSLSIETLRNIDIIDFALYLLDSSCIKDPKKSSLMLNHYSMYSTIFKALNLPYGVILNKADLCTKEELTTLYDLIKSKEPQVNFIVPSCVLHKDALNLLKCKLDSFVETLEDVNKKKDNKGFCRVIKSFDVNPQGVPLKNVKGGVLGVYFYYDPLKRSPGSYYINDRYTKKWEQIDIVEVMTPSNSIPKIGSFSTSTEPFFYKNDKKKGCFVVEQSELSHFKHLDKFTVNFSKKCLVPNKGDQVLIVYEGQSFNALVRKLNKNSIDCILKSQDLYPIFSGESLAIIFSFKKGLTKELLFSGIGTLMV